MCAPSTSACGLLARIAVCRSRPSLSTRCTKQTSARLVTTRCTRPSSVTARSSDAASTSPTRAMNGNGSSTRTPEPLTDAGAPGTGAAVPDGAATGRGDSIMRRRPMRQSMEVRGDVQATSRVPSVSRPRITDGTQVASRPRCSHEDNAGATPGCGLPPAEGGPGVPERRHLAAKLGWVCLAVRKSGWSVPLARPTRHV